MTQTHTSLTPGPMEHHSIGTLLQGVSLQHKAEHSIAASCLISAQITTHLHRAYGTAASIACFPIWHE